MLRELNNIPVLVPIISLLILCFAVYLQGRRIERLERNLKKFKQETIDRDVIISKSVLNTLDICKKVTNKLQIEE